MANEIKLKRSAVQGKVPLTSDLALGELAINTYDGKVYIKKNDGSDSIIEIGGDNYNITDNSDANWLTVDSSENATFTGNVSANGNIYWDSSTHNAFLGTFGSDPIIAFDTNDFLLYDDSNNEYEFYIGSTVVAFLNGSGDLNIDGTLTVGNDCTIADDGNKSLILNADPANTAANSGIQFRIDTTQEAALYPNEFELGSAGSFLIDREVNTQALYISGGNDFTAGGNLILFGGAHSANANDIQLRSGSNIRFQYDDSQNLLKAISASGITLDADPGNSTASSFIAFNVDNVNLGSFESGYFYIWSGGINMQGNEIDMVNGTITMDTNTITNAKVGNWDDAYSWGDHALAGYGSYNITDNSDATFLTVDSSENAVFTAGLTCGTFTSTGIDDNTTGERIQISDSILSLGTSGANYYISHPAADQAMFLNGGDSFLSGSYIGLYGQSHATTAFDVLISKNGGASGNMAKWDDSTGTWTFGTGTGSLSNALTLNAAQNATIYGNLTLSDASNPGLYLNDTTNSNLSRIYTDDNGSLFIQADYGNTSTGTTAFYMSIDNANIIQCAPTYILNNVSTYVNTTDPTLYLRDTDCTDVSDYTGRISFQAGASGTPAYATIGYVGFNSAGVLGVNSDGDVSIRADDANANANTIIQFNIDNATYMQLNSNGFTYSYKDFVVQEASPRFIALDTTNDTQATFLSNDEGSVIFDANSNSVAGRSPIVAMRIEGSNGLRINNDLSIDTFGTVAWDSDTHDAYLGTSGSNPIISFDTGDTIEFVKTSNRFNFNSNSKTVFQIDEGTVDVCRMDSLSTFDDDAHLTVAGGNTYNSGANITLFGGEHSTLANDVRFRSNSESEWFRYDYSANQLRINSTQLQVKGRTGSDYDPQLIVYSNEAAANWARLDFKNINQAQNALLYYDNGGTFGISNYGDGSIIINSDPNNLVANSEIKFKIDNDDEVQISGSGAFVNQQLYWGTNTLGTQAYLGVNGSDPIINFDTNDYLKYDRTNNRLDAYIGNATKFRVDATYVWSYTTFLIWDSSPVIRFADTDDNSDSKIGHNGSETYISCDYNNDVANSTFAIKMDGDSNRVFQIESDGTLNVSGTTNYENLVTADDDIPNKKYVDDAITSGGGGGAFADVQTFTSSGTWTKPSSGTWARIECWGGGGSGASDTDDPGGGGGGGAYKARTILLSSLGSTETVTVGAGGAGVNANNDGNSGGNTSFGSHVEARGGGGGGVSSSGGGGGGGGGYYNKGNSNTGSGGALGGRPYENLVSDTTDIDSINNESSSANKWWDTVGTNVHTVWSFVGGGHGLPIATDTHPDEIAYPSLFGGGGGGGADDSSSAGGTQGGMSIFGGGGGGAGARDPNPGPGDGGPSMYGGHGGAGSHSGTAATAGEQPAGGGGGAEGGLSGAGGAGMIVITVW